MLNQCKNLYFTVLSWGHDAHSPGVAGGMQGWLGNRLQTGNTPLLLTGNNWPPHLVHTSEEQASCDPPAYTLHT